MSERGEDSLCECGCGNHAVTTLTGDMQVTAGLRGARVSATHGDTVTFEQVCDRIRDRRATSSLKRVDGPHPTSSVPVGTGNAQSSGIGEVPKLDPYTEHRVMMDPDLACMRDPKPEALAARARLEAWSRAEKPRVGNRAQLKQMAAGHPSGWPSNEGEE